MIHTPFISYYRYALIDVAVPCFFMISGFLLYNDDKEKFQQRLLKNLKNITKLTILATFFYSFIWDLLMIDPELRPIAETSFKAIIVWIFNNGCPVAGHFWYLYAYIYTLIFVFILVKNNKLNYLKIIVPILLFYVMYFCDVVEEHLKLSIWYTNNYTTAIPYFTIGMFVKKNIDMIREKWKFPIVIYSIFLCLHILSKIYNSYGEHYHFDGLINPFCAFSFFLIFVLAPTWKESWFSRLGRDHSLYIYIFHIIIYCFIVKIGELISPVIFHKIYDQIGALIVIFVCIFVSFIFIKAKNCIFGYFK